MAKSRKRNQSYNKYKKGFGPTPQRLAQTRLSRMESRLTPFVKKDENGKVIGVELPEDSTSSVNPLCPKCQAPMELKRPKAGQKWQPFWGCTMYSVNGCKGNGKDVANKKSQEAIEPETPTIESVVGNQNKINQLELVKKNMQGEYFVNKNIQADSKGSLSWNDVIDLIDEALDDSEYPKTILDQLEAFGVQILAKIQTEQGIAVARKAPKKSTQPKEPEKVYTKSSKHTYNEINQNKEYKADIRTAKATAKKKLHERKQQSHKFGKSKNLNTNVQSTKSNNKKLNCPICGSGMKKREPKNGQAWKAFWGCLKYPTCKGTVNL